MIRYIVGVAPAQTSVTMVNDELAAWCPASVCGKRIRKLFDEQPETRFLNASNIRPLQWMDKSGRRRDVEPRSSIGFELLCALADGCLPPEKLDILLLGHEFWRAAMEQAVGKRRLVLPNKNIPIAAPVPLRNASNEGVGHVTLIAHPARWFEIHEPGEPRAVSRQAFRDTVVARLVKQAHKPGGSRKAPLTAEDYTRVFERFMD